MAIKKPTTKTDSAPPPPQLDISEDSAAYAIGKEAGYQLGLRDGAERERVRWELAKIEEEKARLATEIPSLGPRSVVCEDRAVAWIGYAITAAIIVFIARATWEVILGNCK